MGSPIRRVGKLRLAIDSSFLKLKRVLQKLPFSSLAWDQLAESCSTLKSFGSSSFLKRDEGRPLPCEILAARTKAFHPAKKAGIPKKGIPASISGVDL
jgi:hypothetical protein